LRRCREKLEAEQAQVHAAYEDNLAWRAEWKAEHGRRLGGRKPFPPDSDELAKRSINTTDPGSRKIIRTGKTAVQGYNTQQSNDSGQLQPMIGVAMRELEQAGIKQHPETVLADGGYRNTAQISPRSATKACK
jgi:hypothetical protein